MLSQLMNLLDQQVVVHLAALALLELMEENLGVDPSQKHTTQNEMF